MTGVFVLSLDTELAWGGVDKPMPARRKAEYIETRLIVSSLLELLERYELRATWAVVGHLLLERCETVNGLKHPDIVRPRYAWHEEDWFTNDPCMDLDKEPVWYAPDIVRQIMDCRVPQEIAAHGFSHMIVGDPGCSDESFDSEVRAFAEAAAPFGVVARSFVFPRNAVGHLDVLAAHGYTTYRGVIPRWHAKLPSKLRKLARGAEALMPTTPSPVMPLYERGLCNLPASYNYLHRSGWARLVPMGIRARKAKRGLRKAAEERRVFHMWFHPFNLASDPDRLLQGLDEIFYEAKCLMESGLLLNKTMSEFATLAASV